MKKESTIFLKVVFFAGISATLFIGLLYCSERVFAAAQATIPETALRLTEASAIGATWDEFVSGDWHLPWVNPGGDWIDASGNTQGSVAFATATVFDTDTEQTANFNVTSLVTKHLSSGGDKISNRGWLIFQTSGSTIPTFYSKEYSESTKRPLLTVITTDGTFQLTPGDDISIDASSQIPHGELTTFTSRIGMWFDLAAVTGTVQSATLELHTTNLQYGGGSGVFSVFSIETSQLFAPITEQSGLAAGYSKDQNIETNPNVLFTEKFQDLNMEERGWWWAAGDSSIQNNRSIIGDTDPDNPSYQPLDTGIKAYKMTIPTGEYGGEFGRWLFWSNLGYEPEELYMRAYARMGTDFDSMGGKFPFGFDGTYLPITYLNIGSQNLATNPVTGRVWTRSDAPEYAGNGGATSNGRNGWSARGGFIAEPCGGGCPTVETHPLTNAGYRKLHYYTYHRDQPDAKGEDMNWSSGALGIVQKERWFSIDQYVKLNTVNPDGTGNSDGILRAWVDGRLVFEKTNFRVRDWLGGCCWRK